MEHDSDTFLLPPEVEWRLHKIYTQDIDVRLKELTQLVALQENELAYLWLALFGVVGYILVKEYRGKRRTD
jgi:hypothetical protein